MIGEEVKSSSGSLHNAQVSAMGEFWSHNHPQKFLHLIRQINLIKVRVHQRIGHSGQQHYIHQEPIEKWTYVFVTTQPPLDVAMVGGRFPLAGDCDQPEVGH